VKSGIKKPVGTRVAIGLALVVLTCGYVEAGLVEGEELVETLQRVLRLALREEDLPFRGPRLPVFPRE